MAKPVRKGRNDAMVPGEFINFFTTLAAVGATLFGLIFVVIFHIREVLSPLLSKGEEETTSDKSPAESLEDAPKPRN